MTVQERVMATERLHEMERDKLLPEETLRDLRAWWREKQAEFGAKLIPFPTKAKIIPFPRYAT